MKDRIVNMFVGMLLCILLLQIAWTWHNNVDFYGTTAGSGQLNNTTSPLTFTVVSTSNCPAAPFWLVVFDGVNGNEVMEVTSVNSGTSFTVTRLAPVAHTGTPAVAQIPVAEVITEIQNNVNLCAPLANPSFTGTVTLTSGSKLAMDTGTGTASSGAVTVNKQSGVITTDSLTTAAGSTYTLTLTDSVVTSGSVCVAGAYLGSSTTGTPIVTSVTPSSGSVSVVIKNIDGTNAFNGTLLVNYIMTKP